MWAWHWAQPTVRPSQAVAVVLPGTAELARSNLALPMSPLLGECFAGARRVFERAWGCHNLEVPLSAVCRTEPFAWFACHLLANLPRFHAVYNATVHDYRRQHGLPGQRIRLAQVALDLSPQQAMGLPRWLRVDGGFHRESLLTVPGPVLPYCSENVVMVMV